MIAFLGLGSNLNDRLLNINQAINAISCDSKNQVLNISNFYESEPMYNTSLNKFINAVIQIRTSYDPIDLLYMIKDLEELMGRKHNNERYSNRPIDIDILCCGKTVIKSKELTVPHPHIKERKFVLKPWCDIDSSYIITTENRKIKELLEETPDTSSLKIINT